MSGPQLFSHYPTWPAPVKVPLAVVPEHACSYLPGRAARSRAFLARSIPASVYHELMDAGFRRSGRLLYQPVCRGCRACIPIRVLVDRFSPGKSQRRCWRRNGDLRVEVAAPAPTDEKFALYRRYLRDWHGAATEPGGDAASGAEREDFAAFLYDSPLDDTIEMTYREPGGKLLAVGICDICPARSLSSVYFFFDPAEARRGLGTFGALREIEYAKSLRIGHYYLGYWVSGCRAMDYKSSFRPFQLLGADGVWRDMECRRTDRVVTRGVFCNNINRNEALS